MLKLIVSLKKKVINETRGSTLSSKDTIKYAKNAGEFVLDAKDALMDLVIAYGEEVPISLVAKTLASFDLTMSELRY